MRFTVRTFLSVACTIIVVLAALSCSSTATSAQTPRWSLTRELRIGGRGDTATALTLFDAIVIDAAGRMYVPHAGTGSVRVYESSGRLLRSIDRAGQAPRIGAIGWLGDTLYMVSGDLRRITLYSAAGEPIGGSTLRLVLPTPFSPLGGMRPFADGSIALPATAATALLTSGAVPAVPVFRLDRAGAIIDTLLWRAAGANSLSLDFGERGQLSGAQPFPSDPLLELHDSGAVVIERAPARDASDAFFRIHWIDLRGDTVRTRRYRYSPVPTSKQDIDSANARIRRVAERLHERLNVTIAEFEREAKQKLVIPRYLPPFASGYVTPHGELWLRGAQPGEQARWTIFDARGDIIGTVQLPTGAHVVAVRGSELYTSERVEPGEIYLVRYRVDRRNLSPR